jgi:DNA-directed RNA polymerase specialized sigma subunit
MTKERLKQYRWLKLEMEQLTERLAEHLESSKAGSVSYDGLPGGGQLSDITADLAIKSVELYDALLRKKAECMRLCAEIEESIDTLEPKLRAIMRDYYINGLSWERIAVNCNYSVKHVWRIHGYALKKLRHFATKNML